MTSEIRRSLLLGMTGVLAGCGGGGSSEPQGGSDSSNNIKKSKWTIFLYFNGVNAESGFEKNSDGLFASFSEGGVLSGYIQEALQASPSPDVNILIQTGGAWKDGWKTIRRFKVSNQVQLELSPPKNNSTASMDNADTVAEMIQWGVSDFPAEKYGIIIVGHGGGPRWGYREGQDQLNPGVGINGLGFQKLMASAMKYAGKKIEFLGLNSCLMSYFELASGISDFTNYLIASEENMPIAGFDFTALFNYLSRNPDASGVHVGKRIVNSYVEKNKNNNTITLALTDLSRTTPLQLALDPIFKEMTQKIQKEGLPAWYSIASTRSQALDFSTNIYQGKYTDAMDIASFFRTSKYSSIGISNNLTQNALAAIDSLAPLKRWGKALKETCGVTMYFPTGSLQHPENLDDYLKSNPLSASQQEFIQTYSSFAHNGGVPAITISSITPAANSEINATTSSEYYEWAYSALIDPNGDFISIQNIEGVDNKLSMTNHHVWPTIGGTPIHMVSSIDARNGEDILIIPAQLQNGTSVFLYADEIQDGIYEARTWSSFDRDERHVSSPMIYPILPTMKFQFCSVVVNASIQLKRRPQTFTPNGFGSVEIKMSEFGASDLTGCRVYLGACDYMGRLSLSSSAYAL